MQGLACLVCRAYRTRVQCYSALTLPRLPPQDPDALVRHFPSQLQEDRPHTPVTPASLKGYVRAS